MLDYIDKTLNYYEENAQSYFKEWNNDFLQNYDFTVPDRFLSYLTAGVHILDLGCGFGRDSKYFLDNGYSVTSIDGSKELCKIASEFLGISVLNLNFLNIDFENEFDGVFATASLLHLNNEDLKTFLVKIHRSLKKNGILFCSFKVGNQYRINERFFNDMTREKFETILSEIPGLFDIVETWESEPYKNHRNFINFILRKNDTV